MRGCHNAAENKNPETRKSGRELARTSTSDPHEHVFQHMRGPNMHVWHFRLSSVAIIVADTTGYSCIPLLKETTDGEFRVYRASLRLL